MYYVMSFKGTCDETNAGKFVNEEGKSGFSISGSKEGTVTKHHSVFGSLKSEVFECEFNYPSKCVQVPSNQELAFLFEINESDKDDLFQKFKRLKTKFHNMSHSAECKLTSFDDDGFKQKFNCSPEEVFKIGLTCHKLGSKIPKNEESQFGVSFK